MAPGWSLSLVLLAARKNFVANEHRRERAKKRGGYLQTVSLDAEEAERRFQYGPTTQINPDDVSEYRWAMTVLEQALVRLRAEWRGANYVLETLSPRIWRLGLRVNWR